MSYAARISRGSDLREIADRVIATYGRPSRAEMRDAFGQPSLGAGVNVVVLEYASEHQVRFTISGTAVWGYVITIRHAERRWFENRTLRCARERENAARADR